MTTEVDVIEAWRAATPQGASLASRLYAADIESARLRETMFGVDAVDDFTADYYDQSIEVRLVAPGPVPPLSPLAKAGFRLAWIHTKACEPRCGCQPTGLRGDDADG
jgi:hypothetical protein